MPEPAPLPQLVSELYELVVAYLKQETVVPLKALGRYIAFGLVGAVLLGFGVVFLTMAALRALQAETGSTFAGNWSWAPYGVVIMALGVGGALTWVARGAAKEKRAL